MKSRRLKCLVLGLLGLAWAGSAAALHDVKVMTGAICGPLYGGQWDKLTVTAASGITNNSATASTYVACSVPTDGETAWFSDGYFSAGFRFTGAGGTISCTAYVGDDWYGYEGYSQSVTGAAGELKILAWDNVLVRGLPWLPVGINCKLPPKARLILIYLREPGETDDPSL